VRTALVVERQRHVLRLGERDPAAIACFTAGSPENGG
jgi:hypothetical protein